MRFAMCIFSVDRSVGRPVGQNHKITIFVILMIFRTSIASMCELGVALNIVDELRSSVTAAVAAATIIVAIYISRCRQHFYKQ